MIRHAGRAAALFAIGALFAGGAWAQDVTLVQSVDSAYPVAEELVSGEGGTILLSSANGSMGGALRPVVRLTVTGGNIAMDNSAEITFTLTGATFAQDVGAGDLDLRDSDDNLQSGLASEVIAGGGIDDDEVTFLVEATMAFAETDEISFWVPNLAVMPAQLGMMGEPPAPVVGVGIEANLRQKRAITSVDTNNNVTGVPFPMVTGATNMDGSAIVAARQVVSLADVVSISMAEGGTAGVALDARTMFVSGVPVPMEDGEANALRVGTLSIKVDADIPAFTRDPGKVAVDPDEGLHADLQGNISVMVNGAFKTDDMVVYGPFGSGPYMEAERMGNVATANVAIPTAGAGGTTMTDFLYVPGGEEILRPGKITAMAMDPFDPDMLVMSEGEIKYAGLEIQAYAYGVVKGDGVDSSHLRVRCADSANDCTVFLDCFDQEGENYFQEAGDPIPAGGLAVWSSDDVAEDLKGGWSKGRGACNLHSNAKLEVQHMVLSNHTLINNSDVVGREVVSEDTESLASIQAKLAEICESIDGHPGRAAGMEGTVTINAFDATPCGHSLSKVYHSNNSLHGWAEDTFNGIDTTPGDDTTR